MLRESEVLSMLMRRKPAHSLAQDLYCDPGVLQADLTNIWYREWLFAIPSCEIPKAGDYVVYDVGAYSVVIVRGSDMAIRAFHNTCRHRGSVLCKTKKGRNPKIVCPYHQWTYDLDGRLLWARDMGPDFDPAQNGLKPVHCRNLSGMVYICLAENAPDISELAAETTRYLAPHDLENSKVAFETTTIEQGNWKLVWENNRECYHCAGNHPELCKTFPEAPTVSGVNGAAEDPEIVAHWEKCEAAGLPSQFVIDEAGQFRTTRVPLLREAISYTMSGRKAVQMRLSDNVNMDRIGSLLLYHYPTTWNHVLSDHALTFRVMPLSATETAVTTKWLVHKDAVEGIDYRLDELIHVWTETNDQDRQIVEENAFGIHSPAYQPGPYSEIHEGGVAQFVDWYSSFMQKRLSGAGKPALRSVA